VGSCRTASRRDAGRNLEVKILQIESVALLPEIEGVAESGIAVLKRTSTVRADLKGASFVEIC